MATAAVSAQGTLFKVEASEGVFSTIPEVIRGDTPGITTETIDVTNHDSTAGVRENIAGFKDTDEVTWEGNFIPGNTIQEFLRTSQLAGDSPDFKIFLPGTGGNRVASFKATVRSFRVSANTGEQIRWTMTLKPSGAIVWGTT